MTSAEAQRRLSQYGPNAIEAERAQPVLVLLRKFWAPVPWMLEAAVALQIWLGKLDEALVVGALLVFNAVLSFVQENRANKALDLLRNRLAIEARVLRDSRWQKLPAQALVPGDVIHLRMGDVAPADVRLATGQLLLDQAAVTGESLPVEAAGESNVYAGTVVKRGEATGEVTATGARTFFGRTAELVRTAKTASHLQTIILAIVRYLVGLDIVLVTVLLAYGLATGVPLAELVPFAIILLVASIPVALPATFTLATALGARELAKDGVLVTRLSAIEEAAAMDVLASDKTGTLTENRLTVAGLHACAPYSDDELLRFAALASDDATQDPIDVAVLETARSRGVDLRVPESSRFVPFDPQTKRSERIGDQGGASLRVVKGAPPTIAALVPGAPDLGTEVDRLAAEGCRVLAVAVAKEGRTLEMVGLVGLQDPPRADSRTLVQRLRELGIRVLLVTGDGLATARTVATQVGIVGGACSREALASDLDARALDCEVFAGVFPEDKFHLVSALQRAGRVVGMTGDGVNDAPALKRAEVGIAVASATDVAKAAASIVLVNPGLTDLVAAVVASRRIYQRMLTYTLNMAVKKFEVAFFLSLGFILTGTFVVTPLLIVLWMISNDFITMTIASDRVSSSPTPDRWDIRMLVLTAAAVAGLVLVLLFGVYYAGRDLFDLPLPQLRTLTFAALVFTGQGLVYLVRERGHFWRSLPGYWLMLSSLLDVAVVYVLATQGILMAAVSQPLIVGLLVSILVYLAAVDFLKVRIFGALGLR